MKYQITLKRLHDEAPWTWTVESPIGFVDRGSALSVDDAVYEATLSARREAAGGPEIRYYEIDL